MSNKEKDVQLIPDSNAPSGWQVKHDKSVGNGPTTYPKVHFDKDSGPHLVVFTLPQDSPATFNETDPIWVAQGGNSPAQKGVDPQISDWAVMPGGKALVLLDMNSGQPTTLSYRIKADNYTKALDPIIDNGGGIGGFYSSAEFWVAAGAVSLFFAVAFFFIGRAYQRNLK
jgi:hypothetical protein